MRLQVVDEAGAEIDGVRDDGIGVELDEVEPAEGRGVLVLLSPSIPRSWRSTSKFISACS